ncbi:Protein CBG17897 [Caenorhabditis briggsae]|uniref:Secreted protein n=2 Tax=Caenorhabditis briggsae TaxID=6238 RepID=A0AAE9D0G3_CAEBR|nr:Protein CBG17897 [Caenorhabditis briggsae]ULT87752.1 hypothetical protein L3Y34_007134 [Caenorhabditis briggsae]CAP35439.2 Protein CBG17897 [Caenorhabditis briggsae]
MSNILITELFNWLFFIFLPVSIVSFCSSNDQDRDQLHLERRQALRDRQREAAISGRSVRSVIETEIEPETNQCPRLSCVRMAPKLKTHSGGNTAEVYERLNQNDSQIQILEKEKPPSVEIIVPKEKTAQSGSKESGEEFVDERDRLSAEGGGANSGKNQ